MANRIVIGDFDGQSRVRVSRPGKNVLDPALGEVDLAFDSTWYDGALIIAEKNLQNADIQFDWPNLGYPPVLLLFLGPSNNERAAYKMPVGSYTPFYMGMKYYNIYDVTYDYDRIDWGGLDNFNGSQFGQKAQAIVLANPLTVLSGDGVSGGASWMIGERFGRMGVWVAKDGYDVQTCGIEFMKFAPAWKTLQVLAHGRSAITADTVDLDHDDYGYDPLTIACIDYVPNGSDKQPIVVPWIKHMSRTKTRIWQRVLMNTTDKEYDLGDVVFGDLTWFRLNVPSRSW